MTSLRATTVQADGVGFHWPHESLMAGVAMRRAHPTIRAADAAGFVVAVARRPSFRSPSPARSVCPCRSR